MKKGVLKIISLFFTLLIAGCSKENKQVDESVINFGDLKSMYASDLINVTKFVKLDSPEEALIGAMNQIEIYKDKIYILDRDKTNTLYVFSLEGHFITKLQGNNDGPGNFISPHSFWIDKGGEILILDRMQSKLLKYNLDTLEFICEIPLPAFSPFSFAKIPQEDKYVYYYPLRENNLFENKILLVADSKGEVLHKLYDGLPANKILHGNASNIYLFNNHIRMYPNFSNKIFEIDGDSLNCCYNLMWGNSRMPDKKLFERYKDSRDIMKEISTGRNDLIRLLYIYETAQELLVKYYIKNEFYLSVKNKHTGKTVNVKAKEIVNDLGIGNCFPLPVGLYNNDIVGCINLDVLDKTTVRENSLQKLLKDTSEEGNPLLVFYKFVF